MSMRNYGCKLCIMYHANVHSPLQDRQTKTNRTDNKVNKETDRNAETDRQTGKNADRQT